MDMSGPPPHAAAERTFNTTHCAYQNPEAPPTERGREEEDEEEEEEEGRSSWSKVTCFLAKQQLDYQ